MLQQGQQNLGIFVGRETQQARYQSILEREEEAWLLFLTGDAGIGKTTLLHRLQKQTSEVTTGLLFIDFQEPKPSHLLTDPLRFLEVLAEQAQRFCNGLQYTAFKSAFQQGCEDIERFHEEVRLLNQITEPEQMERIEQNMRTAHPDIEHNVWWIVSNAFYNLIDTLEKRQLVLMLDTCERLLEPGSVRVEQCLMNEFLWQLHDRVVQRDKDCFVVIASREPLSSETIERQDTAIVPLTFFTDEEMQDYLKKADKKMDAPSFKSIVEVTHGHPFTFAMICQLWSEEDEKSADGKKGEDVTRFHSEVAGRVSKAFVQERILQRLGTPYRELTEYGVLLRSFDQPLLQKIFPELFEELSEKQVDKTFDRFIRYPYIEPLEDFRYTFHIFVREVLARYTREQHPKEWERYHQKALAHFNPAEGEQPSPDWYYHFIAASEREGILAWKQAIKQARADGRSEDVGSLLQVAGDKTLGLTPQSQILLLEEEGLFYQDNGQMQKAAESHRQIERIKQEEREREHASDQKATGTGDREKSGRKGRSGQATALSGWKPPWVAPASPPEREVAATEGREVVERRERRRRLPVLGAWRPPRVVDFVIIGVLLVVVLGFVLYNTLYQKSAPAMGIGVSLVGGEPIGLSEGGFAFGCKADTPLMCQAAQKFGQHDIAGAEILWNRALMINKGDAETRIYLADQAVAKAPHVVTFVVATTLTGPNASLGQGDLQGAYLAQQYYNEGLKLPNGYKVRLLIANLGSNPNNATQVANQIVQAAKSDPTIAGVMGFSLSGYLSQAMPILQRAGLPLLSSGASSDVVKGNFPSFFSIVPPDAAQAQAAADYATQTLHAHSAAVFYDPNDASGKGLAKDFEQDFMHLGGFIREEKYSSGQATSLEAGLTDMEGKAPDLLYFAGSASDLNTVLKNSASDNIPVLGSDRLYQLQDYSVSISASKLYFTGFAYPGEWSKLCNSGSLSAQLARQACFNNAFFTVYSFVFNNMQANGESIVSYDALSVLLSAYQYVLSHHLGLQAALQAITDQQAIAGVSGLTAFNGHGNAVNKAIMVLSFDSQKGISLATGSKVPPVCSLVQCKP